MMDVKLTEDEEFLDNITDWQIREYRRTYKPPVVNSSTEKYSPFSFKWTHTEYTPKQLVDNFQQYMPFLVMTTVGYLGRDEKVNSVSSDEVYWLKGILKLSRVVVVNEHGAYFSVPVNCTKPVIALRDHFKVGTPTTLKKLLAQGKHESFMFSDDDSHFVYKDAGLGEYMKLGRLKIVDKYEERHLLVHALCLGTLLHEAAVIPLDLPTALVIAVGMETDEHHQFYKSMLNMHYFVNSIPKAVYFPLYFRDYNDIMVFDGKPGEGEYEMLEPVRQVTPSKINGKNGQKECHVYTQLLVKPSDQQASPLSLTRSNMAVEHFKVNKKQNVGKKDRPKPPKDKTNCTEQHNEHITYLIRSGYSIVKVKTRESLRELAEVLKTGIIPKMSSVKMADCKRNEDPMMKLSHNSHKSDPTSSSSPNAGCSTHVSDNVRRMEVRLELDAALKRRLPSRPDDANFHQSSVTSKTISTSDQCTTSSPSNVDKNKEPPKESGITSFDDIPKDITNLKCEEVGQCLTLLHLSKYKETFEDQQIDGHLLADLDADLLQSSLGFNKFEAVKLVKFINGWRPAAQSSANENPV